MKVLKYLFLSLITFGFPCASYASENLGRETIDYVPIDKSKINVLDKIYSFEPPRTIIPRQSDFPEPKIPPQPQNPVIETPSISPPSSPSVPDIPGKIIIKEFHFTGNTAYSSEKLAELLSSFTNREISFSELISAEQLITNLYVEAGYLNSGAVIMAGQTFDPKGAIININIIEGSIKEIDISGLNRLNPNYVKSRLEIATAKPFNVNKLFESLQMLQLDPLIENISAELAEGIRPQESLLYVKATEADSLSFMPILNNGRNSSVGSFRRGLTIKQDNLFGFGDSLDVSYANTDGSNAVNGSYIIPVNAYNGKIRFSGGFNESTVIQEPFDVLNITGESQYYELSYSQPVIQKPSHELTLGLTLTVESSQSFLNGEPFPLSIGSDINGTTDVTALRFFQDWIVRKPNEVFALRSQFSLGIEALGATINQNLPDGTFLAWRNQAQYVRQLAPDTLFITRSDLQLANQSLVPLEQFYLGGLNSVRGYPQDIRLTDNGFLLSTEVWLPVLRVQNVMNNTNGVLQIIPFVDFGVAWNTGEFPTPTPNTLIGAGLGVQWQMGSNFSARVDWGIPLVHIDIDKKNWNDNGIYFNINAKF